MEKPSKCDVLCMNMASSENLNIINENFSFPTSSFYSSKEKSVEQKFRSSPKSNKENQSIKHKKRIKTRLANRNVYHKIRKPFKKKESTGNFLKTLATDKLKLLPTRRTNKDKIKIVHKRSAKPATPIAIAENLNNNNNDFDFSDSETEIDTIKLINSIEDSDNPPQRNKIFKSSENRRTVKEISLYGNIKLNLSNGRVKLKKENQHKNFRTNTNSKFSKEKEIVENILKSLELSPIKTGIDSTNVSEDNLSNDFIIDRYFKFRKQLPYNTQDPDEIEQQHLLLDFLIDNNICTDENFKIFIKEPLERKTQAEEIINEVLKKQVPEHNYDNIKNLFPIFYGKTDTSCKQNEISLPRRKNFERSAMGLNQYQIDAGQKQFGATQCVECGLIYTCHEPEDEKLHNNYHNSRHILKFDKWTDEDVVAEYPEWSVDGRIIRMRNTCQIKKRNRLIDVLKVVDTELGFSSYVLPKSFVAFLAIRKRRIVGLCLVQFLSSANRYISLNGVDCCSSESFEAKCGVSRIWVSPLNRRLQIASKLILAVQSFTYNGEIINIDKIAFSAPTEAGKLFAQKISNRPDFLVYQ